MKCIHCNHEIEPTTKVCPNCGKNTLYNNYNNFSENGLKIRYILSIVFLILHFLSLGIIVFNKYITIKKETGVVLFLISVLTFFTTLIIGRLFTIDLFTNNYKKKQAKILYTIYLVSSIIYGIIFVILMIMFFKNMAECGKDFG